MDTKTTDGQGSNAGATVRDFTVYFPRGCAIEKAAAVEMGRYAFTGVRVAFQKGAKPDDEGKVPCELVATDGRKLAVVPGYAVGTGMRDVTLPAGVVKTARMGAPAKRADACVRVNGTCSAVDRKGATIAADEVEGEFPDFRAVLPDEDAPGYVAGDGDGARVLAVNVRYLVALADALGVNVLELRIPDRSTYAKRKGMRCVDSGILASPCGTRDEPAPAPEARAVVMPVTDR